LPQFISALNQVGIATCNTPAVNFNTSPLSGILAGIYGGTNAANTGKTMTFGASFTTTGAGAPTLAFPATSFTYTFPAVTDNVVTRTSTDTLTNKSISASEITGVFATAQQINLNTAAIPAVITPTPVLGLMAANNTGTVEAIVSSAQPGVLRMARANNTMASPSGLVANDQIGNLAWSGWDTTIWTLASARIQGIATETWSPSAHGTQYQISATPNGSTTLQLEAIVQNGLALDNGVPKGLGTVNAPNGYYQGNAAISFGGSLSTTGAGPTTFALPSSTATYTFPTVSATLVGTPATFPMVVGTPPVLGLQAADNIGTVEAVASSSRPGVLRFARTDGTFASPTGLVANDEVGNLSWSGWDTTAWSGPSAKIQGIATETWSASAHGTEYQISTTPNGSIAIQTEVTVQNGIASGSGTPKGLGTVNAPNGYYVGSTALAFGGNFTTAGPFTTTGTGPTTFALPSASATYTFPGGGGTMITSGAANVFTQPQKINSNSAAIPAVITPTPMLGLQATDNTGTIEAIVSSAQASVLRLARANNTIASPSGLVANDQIGNLAWSGWDTTAWTLASARVQGIATETWSSGAHGTQYQISATPNGSTTLQLEAIIQNGLALDTGTPQGIGTVNAPSGYYVGSNNVISSARAGTLTSLSVNGNSTSVSPPSFFLTSTLTLAAPDTVAPGLNIAAAAAIPVIRMVRMNNTMASPTASASGDTLGTVNIGGYDGSTFSASATRFQVSATETWTPSAHGSSYSIYSTANGSTTSQLEAMLHSGIASGSGTPQGVGTMNAPSGYYVGSTSIISSLGAGVFPGGLSATLANTNVSLYFVCYNNSTTVFTSDSSGTCTSSSLRFKHDVKPVADAVRKVMAIDAIDFVFNDQSNQRGRQIGLSAESVAAAAPELATFDDVGRPEKVKYLEVIGLLTAAIQDQQREIEQIRKGMTK
jgi:hypothetical protein